MSSIHRRIDECQSCQCRKLVCVCRGVCMHVCVWVWMHVCGCVGVHVRVCFLCLVWTFLTYVFRRGRVCWSVVLLCAAGTRVEASPSGRVSVLRSSEFSLVLAEKKTGWKKNSKQIISTGKVWQNLEFWWQKKTRWKRLSVRLFNLGFREREPGSLPVLFERGKEPGTSLGTLNRTAPQCQRKRRDDAASCDHW